ncbi:MULTISPECIES: hypothetical protein [unclassified Streptomyces]|uniref:hypothetical protein n=1 Tax=unclassified Streptomyces TaxID=2593676 RepID=UPI002DD8E203|nr:MULTISPECIES: hypothetical protein [unclassified Streptomyces]WSA91803.1 hypothetical protein OIE63_09685 [Streptomyces sp. NBC_01795]WSB76173.1 hypothetical protein OHB04_10485 [Streptomyces sp. NBC_01775]WSS15553.1 hypothetical protein OG533_29440 [Streptomyces sp. NBC_01186]WSS44394.1 hypothetical protein OG220_30240 [Streptomyces sp. NBC_01187]
MSERLSYPDVRHADLTPLSEAVAKWKQAPGKFEQVGTNFGTEVTKGLAGSQFEGEAADAAGRRFGKVREQLLAAEEEARRVHTVLSQGLEKFRSAKKALKDIEDELAGHKYLRLNKHDGSVYLETGEDEAGHEAELNKAYQDTFASYRDRTRAALERATQADADLAQALTTDVNGTERGFNDKAYDSLEAARKQSARDLKEALRLARTENGRMDTGQLTRLTALVARHSQDPLFSEEFSTRLGPEKTLKLWYNATHPHNVLYPDTDIDDKAWRKSAKVLQEELGTTLATATNSGTPAMKQWQHDMIKLGDQRLESGGTTHPYGFQVMSNLMRSGKYDSGFLNDYGDKLTAWDKKLNTREGFAYWANSADTDSLNLLGKRGDTGHDAMTGFLEGLGHNPEASTDFFGRPAGGDGVVDRDSELNDHFKYLTQDRNWIFDGNTAAAPRQLPGHEALSHALTAATTGYAWDDQVLAGKDPELFEHGGDRRTAATAGVMEQVVHVYGGEDGPKLLHDQPAMAAGLGAMGGAYVDDINRGISGVGDGLQHTDAFPPAYQGHADFGRDQAVDFLSVLGQNETSHAVMNQAEHLYTLDRFSDRPPSESPEDWATGRRVLLTEAEARGTLDHARVQQIEAQYTADSKEAQDSYQQSANWTRVGMSAGAPAVAQGVLSVVGRSGPWGVVVPIAQAGGVEFTKLFHEDAVFGGPDTPQPPTDKDQFFARGERDLGAAADQYLAGKNLPASGQGMDPEGDLADDIKGKYLAIGPQGNAFEGRAPYPG